MLTTVSFDDQSFFKTGKIENIVLVWMLPAKFQAVHPPAVQKAPELPLCIGHIVPEHTLQTMLQKEFVCLAMHVKTISTKPIPTLTLPLKGRVSPIREFPPHVLRVQ
jgi:hypothetical protein